MVWNLLANAVKFMPESGRVEVQLRVEAEQVWLVVRDTGIGFSAPLPPRVFGCYRQAHSSATRTQGGLELGLFIARHIVEMHQGRVWAVSEGEGKGRLSPSS